MFNLVNERRRRRPRVFLQRQHFLIDANFAQRFRVSPETATRLENILGPHLMHRTRRNDALSPREQVLTTLRFLATNGFYHLIRDAHGPSEATICHTIRRVSLLINHLLFEEIVRWPNYSQRFSVQFEEAGGMPSVCGLIDGTLIKIKKPSQYEEQYVDRHGNHSINVMLVCGPNHQFLYCNASWPGSLNDARVLRNSDLYRQFQSGYRTFPGAVILGDSIYPCVQWLIPPVLGDQLPQNVQRFNAAHKRTRSLIERSIGILKVRFPCLNMLRVNGPEYAAEIIKTCVVLHNLCIEVEGAVEDNVVMEYIQERAEGQLQQEHENGAFIENFNRRRQLIQLFN